MAKRSFDDIDNTDYIPLNKSKKPETDTDSDSDSDIEILVDYNDTYTINRIGKLNNKIDALTKKDRKLRYRINSLTKNFNRLISSHNCLNPLGVMISTMIEKTLVMGKTLFPDILGDVDIESPKFKGKHSTKNTILTRVEILTSILEGFELINSEQNNTNEFINYLKMLRTLKAMYTFIDTLTNDQAIQSFVESSETNS